MGLDLLCRLNPKFSTLFMQKSLHYISKKYQIKWHTYHVQSVDSMLLWKLKKQLSCEAALLDWHLRHAFSHLTSKLEIRWNGYFLLIICIYLEGRRLHDRGPKQPEIFQEIYVMHMTTCETNESTIEVFGNSDCCCHRWGQTLAANDKQERGYYFCVLSSNSNPISK